MKKTFVRILSASLLVLMVLSTFIACGDTGKTETTTAAATETTLKDSRYANDPKLPAIDTDGYDFTVLYNGYPLEPNLDFVCEEANGSALNDAVYNRNMFIQDKYNLVITTVYKKDPQIQEAMRIDEKSGDPQYDLVESCLNYTMPIAIAGYYSELNELTNINIEKPYWYKNLLSGSSIGGKNYFFYSDSCVHAFGATPVTIFNKEVHKDMKLDDLYTLVRNRQWTYEEMSKMVKITTADTSGDNKITIKEDRIGLVANTFCIDCFLSGSGYQMVTKDENDMPVMNVFNETFYNIIDSIESLVSEANGAYLCDRYGSGEQVRDIDPKEAMEQNMALFWIGNFKCVERLRAMPTDFGVIPIPMATADQGDYKVHMQVSVGASMAVPYYVEDKELVSSILEDIAYQSYLTVMPTYMDVLITGQVIRDNDSLESIQIIKNSYYSDPGYMYNSYGIDIISQLHTIIQNNKQVSVDLAKKQKAYNGYISRIVKAINAMEN